MRREGREREREEHANIDDEIIYIVCYAHTLFLLFVIVSSYFMR